VRTTPEQRQQTETRIRAAMDRLLRGDLPPGGKCDIKTLAAEAQITRNGLYTTYAHLKDEFESRRDRLRDTGAITDPTEAQIVRLKTDNAALKRRLADHDTTIAELTEFRTTAVSRLTAQHEEILRLRAHLARHDNVRTLHPTSDKGRPPG
jgi:chromosome segregation ATPase